MRFLLSFLLLFGFTSVAFQSSAIAQEPAARPEIRGVWIHTYQHWDWDAIMPKIAAAGFNTVFVRVARGVNAIYPSQYLPRDGWAEKLAEDELAMAIAAAHRHGLQFHAWKVNFNANAGMRAGDSVKQFYERMVAEDRVVRDHEGKQAASLNPADPRNQDLEANVMLEIATKYPVDGVHFDYIRYPEVPHYDFDYGPVSRAEFEKFIKRPVANWPTDVVSGEDKITYEDWERGNIDRLVERVYKEVKKARPQVQVSAAVWRKHRKYRAQIKQDWIKWVNEGWLDFVCPMDYTKDHADFRADVRAQLANTSGKVPLVAGIGAWLQPTPDDVIKQIQIAREEGADGYALFAYLREESDAVLDALAKGPQAQKTQSPLPLLPRSNSFAVLKNFYIQPMVQRAVYRKDDVPAVQAGQSQRVRIFHPIANAHCTLSVENLEGKVLLERFVPDALPPGTVIVTAMPSSEVEFAMPAGRFRVVVRTRSVEQGGGWRPIELRGPVWEGLPAEKIEELTAREKYSSATADSLIALYADGQASKGILPVLQRAAPEKTLEVYSLINSGHNPYSFYPVNLTSRPGRWPPNPAQVKTLFLPQLNDVADLSQPVVDALRKWVNDGGKLILTHDAVGYRWHPRLFAQVGQGNGLGKSKTIEILTNDFGFTSGAYVTNYPDYVTIAPGPNGVVLARDENGAPVIVGGKVGKGSVILVGSLLGYMPDGKLSPSEERLIQELAR